MNRSIEDVISKEEAQQLKDDFLNMLEDGHIVYEDIENLCMMYGLEPDYIEALM